ncbi:MAG: Phosphoesterase family protein [Acidobacteriaceae bacterium]|nr:Phosphoesterase family protein [Acidobacteriaceae bacterium]
MTRKAILSLLAAAFTSTLFAAEGPVPKGVTHLDHVFVIMMENHGYGQIVGNPNAPFINKYAASANTATNYFAIAHPSLTNYLEVVGGSNFGVHSDNNPDWHNLTCVTNLASGIADTDNPASSAICPIAGTGTDAATPAIDYTNETSGTPGENNIDGTLSIPAANNTLGKTIGDQLVNANKSWKSYQESLPLSGADNVNYSDGFYTDSTDFTQIFPTLNPPLSQGDVVKQYAVKHNPFAYFQNVQEGTEPNNSLANTVGFESLYTDLGSGKVPTFSFIAPNQCNDQHGRGNAGAFCNFDPISDGSQAGLNPALIYLGDVTVQRLVTAIKSSRAWHNGNNAIVVLWDENDYSLAPNTNQVLTIVDTNYGLHGVRSGQFYTHFSLLKSLESGLGLPCLNHACDASVKVMSDLFGGERELE